MPVFWSIDFLGLLSSVASLQLKLMQIQLNVDLFISYLNKTVHTINWGFYILH